MTSNLTNRIPAIECPPFKAFCKGLFYGYRVGRWANLLFTDATSLWQQFTGQCSDKQSEYRDE